MASAEEELQEAIDRYAAFLRHGGSKSSAMGRARRAHVGNLIERAREQKARDLRITEADISRESQKVEVFG